MPLTQGRLGLFASPGSQYADSVVFSALYFARTESCIVFEEPVTLRLVLATDPVLHEAFLFRCRKTIYEKLKQYATSETESMSTSGTVGACGREIENVGLTQKGNPKTGDRWVADLNFYRARDDFAMAEYTLRVNHHIAFDTVVGLIEQARLSGRPMRLFHREQQCAVDCAIGWPSGSGSGPPAFLEAAGLTQRGNPNVAFVPRRGTGDTRFPFATLTVGAGGEMLRLLHPLLYQVADGACVVHLVSPPTTDKPAVTLAASGSARKTKREADEHALSKDRDQKRLTTYFVPRPKKARIEPEPDGPASSVKEIV